MTNSAQSQRPNIILLSVDCWRGDHIGLGGNPDVATPNIDAFAAQGTWFSKNYTCGGWTKIAMTAMLSSTPSSQYDFAKGKVEDERPWLPDALRAAGYKTIGITSNLVCGSAQGFSRGFDHFVDVTPKIKVSLADRILSYRWISRLPRVRLFRWFLWLIGMHPAPQTPTCNANEVIEEGLPWLQQQHDRPFFLWLHFMDLHWPYQALHRPNSSEETEAVWKDRFLWRNMRRRKGRYDPGEQRAKRWKQLYREELEQMDQSFGKLFAALYDMKDWSNTHVVLTSDHGEEFFEHGTWAHSWNQLHSEGAHVPLIVRQADIQQVDTINDAVSSLDISPTILDMANVEKPVEMQGRSLVGDMTGDDKSTAIPVYSEMHGHRDSIKYRLAIVYDNHRYIYDGDRDACYLFNLVEDPAELSNIYHKADSRSRQFDALRLSHVAKGMINILKSDNAVLGEDILYDLDADPKVIDRLRALGYLD